MPSTYTQLRYHLVFATKYRTPLITFALRNDLYDYLGGVLRGNGGVLLKLLKGGSSRWINEQSKTAPDGFSWQEGYGAFTVSASQVPVVRRYILNQEEHHKKVSFVQEFMSLLQKHGVAFNPKDFE